MEINVEDRAIHQVNHSLAIIIHKLRGKDAERQGGYFCMSRDSGTIIHHVPIGIMPVQKSERYRTLSREKADRLRRHVADGHFSSWQSRAPEDDEWGGAIRARDYIFSFSGLPEKADEAVMLHVAIMLGLLSQKDAYPIALESENHYYLGLGCRTFLSSHPSAG